MDKIRSKYTHPDFQFARLKVGGLEFGINVKNLKEITRFREIEKPPGTPEFIDGFLRLRGMLVPVIDLRRRFGFACAATEHTRIVIMSVEGHIEGIVADEVNDIITGGKELVHKPEAGQERPWDQCVDAVVEAGSKRVLIINPSSLMDENEKKLLDRPLS